MSSSQSQVYRYLWAVGSTAAQKSSGSRLGENRYKVFYPHVWIDTQPETDPAVPERLPDEALPYLHLYPYRLHVPEVYGFCKDQETSDEILLLDNVPFNEVGELLPMIAQAWEDATAVRQVYWLWQTLELWKPCSKLRVASSLLSPDNLRVDGWRVRLRELISDAEELNLGVSASFHNPSLADLAECWSVWVPEAKPAVVETLRSMCAEMQIADTTYEQISTQLNQLLLEQAAALPLQLKVFGATEIGTQRSHNEDTCYPITEQSITQVHDELLPRLTIVCDGIGGHEGGEVASQLAVQSLQLQVKALLTEVAEQSEPVQPDLMCEELAAIVRVVNNMISAQNDAQAREARRRMGTTLVMTLQLPQRVKLSSGAVASNAHEVYIVNVGDSRAYWITPQYCHQLTVDDDVAVREVRMGRALYREALKRPDASALTQALGTRDSEYLYPTVQRFMIEEDGILLLCSDGVSDNGLVEQSWADYAELILAEKFSLESAVRSWLEFANEKNGHDNASIVLTHCRVSSSLPDVPVAIERSRVLPPEPIRLEQRQLSLVPVEELPDQRRRSGGFVKTLVFLMLCGAIGSGVWYVTNPTGVQRFQEQVTRTFFKQ